MHTGYSLIRSFSRQIALWTKYCRLNNEEGSKANQTWLCKLCLFWFLGALHQLFMISPLFMTVEGGRENHWQAKKIQLINKP